MSILDGKTVLLTGGTGSFGTEFCRVALAEHKPRAIRVFSRGEAAQERMERRFSDDRLRFFIGDVRDLKRLERAMNGANVVIHAAALKIVPKGEYDSEEFKKTNIDGTLNVIDAALSCKPEKCIFISTDKSVAALNLYGTTKAVAERLWIQANVFRGSQAIPQFSAVRYGNVAFSSGSVVPLFLEQKKTGCLTITSEKMTRFWLDLETGVNFVISSMEIMKGGEVFIPKLPSVKVTDLAEAIAPDCKYIITGIRPGEKLHEILITEDETRRTIELEDRYIIEPAHPFWTEDFSVGSPLPEGFSYASNTNKEWLTVEQLKEMVCKLQS